MCFAWVPLSYARTHIISWRPEVNSEQKWVAKSGTRNKRGVLTKTTNYSTEVKTRREGTYHRVREVKLKTLRVGHEGKKQGGKFKPNAARKGENIEKGHSSFTTALSSERASDSGENQVVHRTPNLHKNPTNAETAACFPERANDCGRKERRSTKEGENNGEGRSVVKTDPEEIGRKTETT